MPKAFPLEFRRDVVAVARKGEASLCRNGTASVDGADRQGAVRDALAPVLWPRAAKHLAGCR